MRTLRTIAAFSVALLTLLWRRTCRYEIVCDPRPALRAQKKPYAYALLHAHQIAAVFASDEPTLAAMVSRSADGDLIVPLLKLRHMRAVRGSTRKGDRDKGGAEALAMLTKLAFERVPVLFAVDGPRGPRNHVHRGIARLAQETGAAILPTLALPSRRWFLRRTWDRMQIPAPFCRIRLIFGAPLTPQPGGDPEDLRQKVARALDALEARYDPREHP